MTGFEEETGCQVNVTLGNTSDEMVQPDADRASTTACRHRATPPTALIAGGEVAPVNTDLIPNYADIFDDLKLQAHNSVDDVSYGVPHGRGANLLVFNTDTYPTAPDSWGEMFEASSAGCRLGDLVYDTPIYIADAAVYLMATQPDLEIDEPVRARPGAVRRRDRPARAAEGVGRAVLDVYYVISRPALEGGTALVGTTWQVIVT